MAGSKPIGWRCVACLLDPSVCAGPPIHKDVGVGRPAITARFLDSKNMTPTQILKKHRSNEITTSEALDLVGQALELGVDPSAYDEVLGEILGEQIEPEDNERAAAWEQSYRRRNG